MVNQVNQDLTARQYTQNIGQYGAANAVAATEAAKTDSQAAETGKAQAPAPDMDKVELSSSAQAVNKMSDADRAALVESLKADLDTQMNKFTNMMTQMFSKQGITASIADGDDFWKTIASGNYTVDAQTKADAQAAISEDGYWGVKQTSQRIFDFAQALAGDDPDKMKKMQAAVEKGFDQAEKAWGGDLPSISGETHSAINKLFDEYYTKNGVAAAAVEG